MGRLSHSFRSKNKTTLGFRKQYSQLPANVQALTRTACELFDANPGYNSLRHHQLVPRHNSSALSGSWSVSITMQYRAIYVVDSNDLNSWYWIGSHADYDRYVGKK